MGHFQPLSSQDEASSQFGRQQVPSGIQIPLPNIAPRPSNQEDQAAMQAMGVTMNQRLPAGSYGYSGFSADGQTYTSSDLPPRMRQHFDRQGNSYDGGLITPKSERSIGAVAESPSYPLFQHYQSTGGSDSGIDMTFPGLPSDWSQSSPSGTVVHSTYLNGPANGVSSTIGNTPAQYYSDPAMQALFAAQLDQAHQSNWQPSTQDKCSEVHSAFLPPEANQRYQQPDEALLNLGPGEPSIKGNIPLSGLKGNGKHRAILYSN